MLQEATVTYINTAAELIAAVEKGDPHIEILSHLDFKDFPPRPVGNDFNSTATVIVDSVTVRSIRVRLCELFRCSHNIKQLKRVELNTDVHY